MDEKMREEEMKPTTLRNATPQLIYLQDHLAVLTTASLVVQADLE